MKTHVRAALQDALANTHSQTVRLVLSTSTEGYAYQLRDLPGIQFQTVSLETQQMGMGPTDVEPSNVDDTPIVAPSKPTTVYVVSRPSGTNTLTEDDQAIVRTAVDDRVSNNTHVILALLPAKSLIAPAPLSATVQEIDEDLPVADRSRIDGAVRQLLDATDIPVADSLESLHSLLQAIPTTSKVTFDSIKSSIQ